MSRRTRTRCYELIRDNEVLPKASESLKQRILLAATRARNRQRLNHQIAGTLCSFAILFMVTANSFDSLLSFNLNHSNVSANDQVSNYTQASNTKPVIIWNNYGSETELVDSYLEYKNWQSSFFKKTTTRL